MQAAQMVQAVQASTGGNMNALFQHPLYQQAAGIAARYNGDWRRAFVETAKENGIDPNMILSTIKGSFG